MIPWVKDLYVRFETLEGGKAAVESVSVEVWRAHDNCVLATRAQLGHRGEEWAAAAVQPATGEARFGEQPGWFVLDRRPVKLVAGERSSLRVAKTGDGSWALRVELAARLEDGTMLTLLSAEGKLTAETRDTVFETTFALTQPPGATQEEGPQP